MNTKQLILEKTLKLMIEKQNSLISIREISTATGIATGGIYHHFSNKEEIADAGHQIGGGKAAELPEIIG